MDKKQLVNGILDKVEAAEVVLGARQSLRSEYARLWELYPDGHYNAGNSVEEELACLTEEQLQQIAALPIEQGVKFRDLWRSWGKAGVFKCKPELMAFDSGVPILRLRHDCYLHWMRGYCFQNSYDAHCSGSNGSSGNNLGADMSIVTIPPYFSMWDEEDENGDVQKLWRDKWALFRKALILSHPFMACAGKVAFYDMMDINTAIFEEFFNLTDEKVMKLYLDADLTIERMKQICAETDFNCAPMVDLAVMDPNDKAMQIGVLKYGRTAVQFTYQQDGELKQMTVQFPAWDRESYICEMREIGDMAAGSPSSPCEADYLYSIWCGLTTTLLTFAGLDPRGFWATRKSSIYDVSPVCFYPKDKQVCNVEQVWDILYDARRDLYDFDKMVEEFMK